MPGARMIRLTLLAGTALLVLAVMTAFAASNTVPKSLLSQQSFAITANSLKPAGCAALNLSVIVTGSGHITHNGSSNALILGSAGDDIITGGSGSDCILAGGGQNTIDGGPGNKPNVCYGNKTDRFTNCTTIIYY